jgi:hypothetical protein
MTALLNYDCCSQANILDKATQIRSHWPPTYVSPTTSHCIQDQVQPHNIYLCLLGSNLYIELVPPSMKYFQIHMCVHVLAHICTCTYTYNLYTVELLSYLQFSKYAMIYTCYFGQESCHQSFLLLNVLTSVECLPKGILRRVPSDYIIAFIKTS